MFVLDSAEIGWIVAYGRLEAGYAACPDNSHRSGRGGFESWHGWEEIRLGCVASFV